MKMLQTLSSQVTAPAHFTSLSALCFVAKWLTTSLGTDEGGNLRPLHSGCCGCRTLRPASAGVRALRRLGTHRAAAAAAPHPRRPDDRGAGAWPAPSRPGAATVGLKSVLNICAVAEF